MYRVAVVGATGLVGETMLRSSRSESSPSRAHSARERALRRQDRAFRAAKTGPVQDLAKFDFKDVQIGLFSAGGSVSAEHAPRAGAAGCVVIDNTSKFRYDADIPLVVPEVNPEAIAQYKARNIIANPNCSTIQMVVALKPIHDAAGGITRINVATYQSVSGAGRRSVETLLRQTAQALAGQPVQTEGAAQQIAFNVVPHIDDFQANGYTKEEMKMVWETRKILGDESHPGESRPPCACRCSSGIPRPCTSRPATRSPPREVAGAARAGAGRHRGGRGPPRRLSDGGDRSARTAIRSTSGASARTFPASGASASGWWPTTSARVRP